MEEELKAAVKQHGAGSVVCILSPFDATEEMFLQIKYVRSIDPQAWLVMNPVRVEGEDQVFKNPTTGQVTFVIKAEKAPNRVGAEKMMKHFGGNVCHLGDLHEKIKNKKVTAAVLASDPFPATHVADYRQVLGGIQTIVRLGTRGGAVYEKATLSLPTVTWAEKSGVYENYAGRIQPFGQAIMPLDGTRANGQVFWDLLGHPGHYNATAVRVMMASAGLGEYAGVEEPVSVAYVDDMQFAEL
jgi:anaerobic selenocysteine-containing dehydrogenase